LYKLSKNHDFIFIYSNMSKNTDKWIGKQFDKLKVISCEKQYHLNIMFILIVCVSVVKLLI